MVRLSHYQKINKYKRKYRGNIPVGKFSREFNEGNISSVYTEGFTAGKKNSKKKKIMTCHFLPTDYRRNCSLGNSVGKSVGNSVGKL